MPRFSKARLIRELDAMADKLEKEHGFDPTNGWNQVAAGDIPIVVAYGEYVLLHRLAQEVEDGYLGTREESAG